MVGYFYEVYGHVPTSPVSHWWYECTDCFIALLTLTARRILGELNKQAAVVRDMIKWRDPYRCPENPDKDLGTHLWVFAPVEDTHPPEVQAIWPAYIYCAYCMMCAPIKKDDVMNFWLKPVEVEDDDAER